MNLPFKYIAGKTGGEGMGEQGSERRRGSRGEEDIKEGQGEGDK